MRRWIVGIGAALAVAAVAAVYWLFYDNRMPGSGDFPLDLAAIRAEAGHFPGPGPTRIETEMVSHVGVRRSPWSPAPAGARSTWRG